MVGVERCTFPEDFIMENTISALKAASRANDISRVEMSWFGARVQAQVCLERDGVCIQVEGEASVTLSLSLEAFVTQHNVVLA